jgi:PKD repeat protein
MVPHPAETFDRNRMAKSREAPVVRRSFSGSEFIGNPPDNNIAVSRAGAIVSVINSTMTLLSREGEILGQWYFSDLIGSSGDYASRHFFDPHIRYDEAADRFILVVCNATIAEDSHVVIGFSATADPAGRWNFYALPGDPGFNEGWFDFPGVGFNNADVFVTGNIFHDDRWSYGSMIYQIDKAAGYAGESISYWYYNKRGENGRMRDFSLVPATEVFGTPTEEMYLIRGGYISCRDGCQKVFSGYHISGATRGNPTIRGVDYGRIPHLGRHGDARQLGSDYLVNTVNGERVLSAFRVNDTIHFAGHFGMTNERTGLYYGKTNVVSGKATAGFFGHDSFDYAYPAIVPYTTDTTDNTALLAFLASGADIYPEYRAVKVRGNFEWSPSTLIKAGESFLNKPTDRGSYRWGDYTGIARRPLPDRAEVWTAGSYGGPQNGLNTWVAQFINEEELKGVIAEFTADTLTPRQRDTLRFTDHSLGDPTAWRWSFPGGTPATATTANPTVVYADVGTNDVTLIASKEGWSDTIVRERYIEVGYRMPAPVADFAGPETTYVGDTIQFDNFTTGDSLSYQWSFPGGTPATSPDLQPLVTYSSPGTYDVRLVATNDGGRDTILRRDYIDVLPEVVRPVAAFSTFDTLIAIGDTAYFENASENVPDLLRWHFPGGIPSTSTEAFPAITYGKPGSFAVTLIASNRAGSDTLVRTGYVTVERSVATRRWDTAVSSLSVYPNPGRQHQRISVELGLRAARVFDLVLYDGGGRRVRRLLRHRGRPGRNLVTFNGTLLSAGAYRVVVHGAGGLPLASRTLVIR